VAVGRGRGGGHGGGLVYRGGRARPCSRRGPSYEAGLGSGGRGCARDAGGAMGLAAEGGELTRDSPWRLWNNQTDGVRDDRGARPTATRTSGRHQVHD